MDVLNDLECGKIRTCPVYIQGSKHVPPKAEEVEERLLNLVNH